MIILPAIACAIAIVLAVLFEASYAYVEQRWTISDKEMWAFGFWCVVCAVLVCCKVMPLRQPGMLQWAPFAVVVFFHMVAVLDGESFTRRPGSPLLHPPDSKPATPPGDSNGQDSNSLKKPKQQNQDA